jgi:hypothetical protein
MTIDYTVNLRDSTGRTAVLHISGDTISEMVSDGLPEWQAREEVEGNTFANAIAEGLIGADAWLINEIDG